MHSQTRRSHAIPVFVLLSQSTNSKRIALEDGDNGCILIDRVPMFHGYLWGTLLALLVGEVCLFSMFARVCRAKGISS